MGQQIAQVTFHSQYHDFSEPMKKKIEIIGQYQDTRIENRQDADFLIQKGYQIKQWNAIRLYIQKASNDGVQKAIGEIIFPYLKLLDIQNNQIQTIEMLARLSAPNLQQISLSKNNISITNSLRKMQSNKISKLWIIDNLIRDASFLTEIDWKNSQVIGIENQNSYCCQNLAVFVKMGNNKKSSLKLLIRSKCRISQKFWLNKLYQKYSQNNFKVLTNK